MGRWFLAALVLFGLAALPAGAQEPPVPTTIGAATELLGLDPPAGTRLIAGSTVTVTARVGYHLDVPQAAPEASRRGALKLIFLDEAGHSVAPTVDQSLSVSETPRLGRATLSITLTVPPRARFLTVTAAVLGDADTPMPIVGRFASFGYQVGPPAP